MSMASRWLKAKRTDSANSANYSKGADRASGVYLGDNRRVSATLSNDAVSVRRYQL